MAEEPAIASQGGVVRGREAIRIGSRLVMLERFAIDGVVWGRETLWLDEHGSLAAAVTRAGGLSFEAVREDLEPALVTFVGSATRDRIGDLAHRVGRVDRRRQQLAANAGGPSHRADDA